MPETPVVERAFQLARTGNYPSVEGIRRQLSREGYASADLGISGPVLQKQLRALIKEAIAEQGDISPPPEPDPATPDKPD